MVINRVSFSIKRLIKGMIGDNLEYIQNCFKLTEINTKGYPKFDSCKCSAEDFATMQAIKDIKDNCISNFEFFDSERLNFLQFLCHS